MEATRAPLWRLHAIGWLAGLVVLVGLLGLVPGVSRYAPDYLQFWSASTILATGGNPYDPVLQARYNRLQGWDLQRDGVGRFAFLPYYYPPWVGLVLIVLLPFGYSTAKLIWFAILIEAVAASALLLRRSVTTLAPWLTMALVCGFGIWRTTIAVGQTAPLIVLLMAAAWRLAQARRDRASGWALAWLSIKPQLTLCVVLGVLVWAVRQRRWRMLEGFITACVVIGLASSLVVPGWLPAMLNAPRETPLVTAEDPVMGTTWYCLLRTLGYEGSTLLVLYLALAVQAVAVILGSAWNRETPLLKLLGLTSLAAVVLAPYARYYDLPILLFSLLWLLEGPLPKLARASLVGAFMIVPVVLWLVAGPTIPDAMMVGRWTWLVATLAVAWLWSARLENSRPTPTAHDRATKAAWA